MTTPQKKHVSQSRTIRFNFAIKMIAAAMLVAEANLHLLSHSVPPWAYLVVIMIVAGINEGLRIVTSQPVTFKKAQGE